ncbi:GntR family transcriptional regulator [Roseovarius halotolerans]|uniref:Putative HTH-type transcriptional regulator YjiR n=1 Tax=Roseovarius halotolerans TaxID=505353 RepID=A0A1X6Y9J0_9RHOB|nr:PLP-dependent aminotransferase family protein [Roseovarius halotolerans]RKT35049.1 GntR family transcriptional regulator [Roseovarius halotolerans]SLN14572.1 putative HTH-type transcriptional regulator YjiR [Roseovarius halotolerans]
MTFEFPDREALAEPLYASLAAAIERQIREGVLRPGDRLPTHRAVSNELGLSVHTVSKAYDRLRQHNLIHGHVGRGSFVVDPSARDEPPYALKSQREDVLDLAISRPLYDARHDQAMRRTLREMAGNADPATILSCRPNIGQTAHRAAAVDWLARCRLNTSADRVLLTNGVTHGMAAALSAVTAPGDVVLADDVTHHLIISLCRYLGLTLIGVAGDDEGMCPDALERVCRSHDARAIVTLPNLAAPRGGLMSEARRRAVAAVAQARDLVVIENDAYAQILEDAPEPIAALAPERTIYLTTFTKCTVSGLRAGYMAAPAYLQSALLSRLLVFSWAATPLVGEIATRWVRDGTAAALAEWQRAALAARGRIVNEVLGDQRLQGHPGGLHYWLTLPEGRSTEDVVRNARQLGVALAPATPFLTAQAPALDAVRISVGGVRDETQFRTALERVSMLLRATHEIAFPLEY